jgi:hypothetical protein
MQIHSSCTGIRRRDFMKKTAGRAATTSALSVHGRGYTSLSASVRSGVLKAGHTCEIDSQQLRS